MKKEFPGYRIIALFGAPGGKAYERRTELPQEAAKWADYLIYTEEAPANDPGDETRQHEGNDFVPCRPDGDIFQDAVREHAAKAKAEQ